MQFLSKYNKNKNQSINLKKKVTAKIWRKGKILWNLFIALTGNLSCDRPIAESVQAANLGEEIE